jgi:hypothetical protein
MAKPILLLNGGVFCGTRDSRKPWLRALARQPLRTIPPRFVANAVIRLLTRRAPATGGSADPAHAGRAPAAETAARCLVDDRCVLRLCLDRAGTLRLRLRGKGERHEHECASKADCELAHLGLLYLVGVNHDIWSG